MEAKTMKKKLLLLALPMLMALSACSGVSNKQVEKPLNFADVVIEDTLAHDEIFGNEKLPSLGVRNLDAIDAAQPAFGIQSHEETVEINHVDTECISIRFIAAIKIVDRNDDHVVDDLDLAATNAVWQRTLFEGNGDIVNTPGSFSEMVSQKAYTTLADGGGELTIDDFNNSHLPATDYTHFVVCSLINIPKEAFGDYFITLGFMINDPNVNPFMIAVSVDLTKQMVFDMADFNHEREYYLVGKNADGTKLVVEEDAETQGANPENNFASFTHSFNQNDEFVIVWIKSADENSKFKIWNSSVLTGDGNNIGTYFENSNRKIKALFKGDYVLYFNNSSQLWQSSNHVETNGYLYVDVNVSWWGNDSAWTSVYAYTGDLNGEHTGKWFALTGAFYGNTFRTHTSEEFFNATTYTAGYTTVAVCRLRNGTNLPDDKTEWDGSIVDNRYDVALKTNGLEDCIYLYNNVEYSMGSRS